MENNNSLQPKIRENKEFNGRNLCTEKDCLKCDRNDWCWFSDTRKISDVNSK